MISIPAKCSSFNTLKGTILRQNNWENIFQHTPGCLQACLEWQGENQRESSGHQKSQIKCSGMFLRPQGVC